MSLIAACVLAAAASWLLTAALLRLAPLDYPGDRSLHAVPTPRGGGLSVVVVFLGAVLLGLVWRLVDARMAVALWGAGTLVAAVGWLDDRRGLSARVRLIAHAMAGAWAVCWLGGVPDVTIGTTVVSLGALGDPLAVIAIMWTINLYNFMDGSDGLAGLEAVCVCVGGAALLSHAGAGGLAWLALILAGAVVGFLGWNWAPARIFLGDVGSGFLGLVVAVLAIGGESRAGLSALYWVAMGMVFVLDATLTLLRRAVRSERIFSAHRSHAYQRLVQSGWSHGRLALAVLGVNLVLIGLTALGSVLAVLIAMILVGVLYALVERVHPM